MAHASALLGAHVLVLCCVIGVCSAGVPVTVRTRDGNLTGFSNKQGTRMFLGVPFAEPPVGDLRWRAPQAKAPWGSRNASKYAPACYQHKNTFTDLNSVSEDCLYLNVYAPPAAKSSELPTLIFFYGGTWAIGSSSFVLYDGAPDVNLVEDAIIVTANYRLNVFGFLGSQHLQEGDASLSTGNYGLLDQRMAMRWVQENVAAFGGDPKNVMIFGESAGAGSVSCHLLMPNSWPFFQRAAMESGPIADWTAKPFAAAEQDFAVTRDALACPASPVSATLACMRAANASALLKASNGVPQTLAGVVQWSPVIDLVELTDVPTKLAEQGKLAKVPVMLGTNHDEGTMFIGKNHEMDRAGMLAEVTRMVGPRLAAEAMPMYPLSNYSTEYPNNTAWWATSHLFGDSQMSCPARQTARWLQATGQPVFLYFYSRELWFVKLFLPFIAVCHGSELVMVFDTPLLPLNADERSLAQTFVRYWTRFAATGDPNGGSDPSWPQYTTEGDQTIRLDVPISVDTGLKRPECDFWATHMPTLWQPTVSK